MSQKKCKHNNFHCPYHACMGDGCQHSIMNKEDRKWVRLCSPDIRKTDAGTLIFVKYSKADRCEKCFLANHPDVCFKTDCNSAERTDLLNGYFREFNASILPEQPAPKGLLLLVLLVLFSASVLFSSCGSVKVTVEYNPNRVECDSSSVENSWY